jgi:hypothetical protein
MDVRRWGPDTLGPSKEHPQNPFESGQWDTFEVQCKKEIDASAYFLNQGWFGDITLHVVVAYPLPSIRLAPPAECQQFISYQLDRCL